MQFQIEDAGGGLVTVNEQSTEIEVPKTGAFNKTGTIAGVACGVNKNLLFVRDRDCEIPGMDVSWSAGGTDYDVNFDRQFGGMTCGGPFNWPTGAEP